MRTDGFGHVLLSETLTREQTSKRPKFNGVDGETLRVITKEGGVCLCKEGIWINTMLT